MEISSAEDLARKISTGVSAGRADKVEEASRLERMAVRYFLTITTKTPDNLFYYINAIPQKSVASAVDRDGR